MLDEMNHLTRRQDYTAWKEAEEQVVSFAAKDAVDRAREEMAA